MTSRRPNQTIRVLHHSQTLVIHPSKPTMMFLLPSLGRLTARRTVTMIETESVKNLTFFIFVAPPFASLMKCIARSCHWMTMVLTWTSTYDVSREGV